MATRSVNPPAARPRMLRTRIAMGFCLFAVMPASGDAAPAIPLTPGMPHYFDSFDAGQRPWTPGQPLNIEEVFKNYQYYEVTLDRDGNGIVVNQYIRGSKTDSGRYRILPDGSLQRIEP